MHLKAYQKNDVYGLSAHYERWEDYKHDNVDASRTHLNKNYYKGIQPYELTKWFDERTKEIEVYKTCKKFFFDLIVNAPSDLPKEREDEWWSNVARFVANRYGHNNVGGVFVHRDEGKTLKENERRSHAHIPILPVYEKDGKERLSAREVFNPTEFKTLQPNFIKFMNERMGKAYKIEKTELEKDETKGENNLNEKEFKERKALQREIKNLKREASHLKEMTEDFKKGYDLHFQKAVTEEARAKKAEAFYNGHKNFVLNDSPKEIDGKVERYTKGFGKNKKEYVDIHKMSADVYKDICDRWAFRSRTKDACEVFDKSKKEFIDYFKGVNGEKLEAERNKNQELKRQNEEFANTIWNYDQKVKKKQTAIDALVKFISAQTGYNVDVNKVLKWYEDLERENDRDEYER